MRIIELFGGIGACTKALKRIGVNVKVVDYVEIDKYAVNSYNAINGTNFKPQDITEWDKDLKDIDLIMGGFPCQTFSMAGKRKGFEEYERYILNDGFDFWEYKGEGVLSLSFFKNDNTENYKTSYSIISKEEFESKIDEIHKKEEIERLEKEIKRLKGENE